MSICTTKVRMNCSSSVLMRPRVARAAVHGQQRAASAANAPTLIAKKAVSAGARCAAVSRPAYSTRWYTNGTWRARAARGAWCVVRGAWCVGVSKERGVAHTHTHTHTRMTFSARHGAVRMFSLAGYGRQRGARQPPRSNRPAGPHSPPPRRRARHTAWRPRGRCAPSRAPSS